MLRPNERYDAGKSDEEAAIDIAMNRFRDWGEPERLVVNVDPPIANLRDVVDCPALCVSLTRWLTLSSGRARVPPGVGTAGCVRIENAYNTL